MSILGIGLMAFGVCLFLYRFLTRDNCKISADRGGVAIKGDFHGTVITGAGGDSDKGGSSDLDKFNFFAGLCSVAGILLALWEFFTK